MKDKLEEKMKEMSNSARIGTILLLNVVCLGLFAVPEADRAALDEHAVPTHRTVRIASFREVISPAVGAKICGYDADQVSVTKHDDLWAIGLAIDDGTKKAMIVSFDLVGLDGETVRALRKKCATAFGVGESAVLFSCTHNHSGPESVRRFNMPQFINREYLAFLEERLLHGVASLEKAPWTTCRVLFNSAFPDENYNRRYVTSDNCATFVPLRREYQPLCRRAHTDQELGLLLFYDESRVAGRDGPVFVVGNYAAHALSSHSAGLGGIRISADFPGFFRDYIKSETGADALFVQGASGDVCPLGDEEGMGAARKTGENLARAAISAMCDADRNQGRFTLAKPTIASSIRTLHLPIRSDLRGRIQPEYDASDDMAVEVQCLALGDVAFAGMPGELLCEPGLEIKWNSPFRRTWIANLSTGFCGYIVPPNFMVAGGYEPLKQSFRSRGTFRLVSETIDQLFELRKESFPEDSAGADPYPDNVTRPIVNIPGGVKYRKVKAPKRKVR